MRLDRVATAILLLAFGLTVTCDAGVNSVRASDLRLIPFPKKVVPRDGTMTMQPRMRIVVVGSSAARQAAMDLKSELEATTGTQCRVEDVLADPKASFAYLAIAGSPTASSAVKRALGQLPSQGESYRMVVERGGAYVGSRSGAGLECGIQTLIQLVRANSTDRSIPCLDITDWPSLSYRGFQEDMTRGPSLRLEVLESDAHLGRSLKMNFMTYYMEHQFAYQKYPYIGPKTGSMTQQELRALVDYAKGWGLEVFGCQQSFGHMWAILCHDELKALRETGGLLTPANEDTYRFLDDLYSEQMPALDSKFFNVCCDETDGLGTGAAKALADKEGVGAVYVRHINRLHDIITGKYGKRMMMWGDIIIGHPDQLGKIPKDTLMLAWSYTPGRNFDRQILPVKNGGYDFFVCPGVHSWAPIIPDFHSAEVNIGNFVREGVKRGAMGMLNTSWADTGQNLLPCNWHGFAWGAECAWTGSKTSMEDFNRRIGPVMFGERDNHFGKAMSYLRSIHRAPGFSNLSMGRFWEPDFGNLRASKATLRDWNRGLLALADPALSELRAARAEARVNAYVLDYFILGVERVKLIADRSLAYLDAADAYERARRAGDRSDASAALERATALVRQVRDAHASQKQRYNDLWLRAQKPYALSWVLAKYDAYISNYDKILDALAKSGQALGAKSEMLSASEVGLEIVEPASSPAGSGAR